MMYEYMTLDDHTAIAHSEMKQDGTVRVYIEKPIEGGFASASCSLPSYQWTGCEGFSDTELAALRRFVENNAHLIIEKSETAA